MGIAFIREEGLPPLWICVDKSPQLYYPRSPPLPSPRPPLQLSLPDMRRKRGQSLQALFIPPFLQSSATNRFRSRSETGRTQPVTINSPTTPTTTSSPQDSPQLDPFSQALYSFTSTDNVVSLDSPYTDLLDTDPFANLSTPPRSPTNQDNSSPQQPSVHSVIPAPTTPRSPLSPAEHRAQPLNAAGIRYTSATTPSSPVSGAFHPSSLARPAYTKPVFKSTPSLPSLRALSQGQYIPACKIRKGHVGATLPVEPWNQIEAADPVLEESWLSSLDIPSPSERASAHDRVRATDNVVIYSGGFNDSTEDLVSSADAPVQQGMDFRIPPSLSRHPSDPSFLSAWDDGLSSLSSFTAESESDFQTSTSSTWSAFSRRSSGEGNTSSIFDVLLPLGVDTFNTGADLSRSSSNSSISLSDEDLVLPPPVGDSRILAPLSLSVDFRPGTSAETIRPSPSQLMGLRLSERLPSEGHSRQSSRSSTQSSSVVSPPATRPVTPNPSECSSFSIEGPEEEDDEDGILYDWDVEYDNDQADDIEDDHQYFSEVETACDRSSLVIGDLRGNNVKGDLPSANSEQPQDGEGSSSGYYGGGGYTSPSSNGYGYGGLGSRSSGTHRPNGGASGSGGGRDGDGRRPSQPSTSLHGMEEDQDTDSEYGEDEPSPSLRQSAAPVKKQSSDEDDLPLARSIPTALKAQKSIRQKVRQENAQRRQERAMRMQAKIQNVSGVSQSPGHITTTFQHEQTSPPQVPSRTTGRARTQTSPLSPTTRRSPFAMDDLTKKLIDVQTSMTGPNSQDLHRSGTRPSPQRTQEPGPSKSRPSQESPAPSYPIHETFQKPTLRPMRSFHRPAKVSQPETHEPLPVSGFGGASLTPSRSIRRPRTGDLTTDQPFISDLPNFTLQRSKSTRSQSQIRPSDEDHGSTGRPSMSRPSAELPVDSRAHWSDKAAALPPVPPIPTYDMLMRQKSGESWQQKVFLGDTQRSTIVEVGATTSAQDVIDAIESRGEMGPYDPNNTGGKGWMLFELAQDFGMERPIRSFEVLADIRASWSKEKTVNSILLKRTALSSRLAVEALPSTSPTCRGYLEYEVKRGKWSKRWVELRDNSLWLAKRDNGRDEVFLCKLTNFDVYSVTRVMKTPKPFVFAVKSTENLSLFENTADYLHTFCCKEKDGLEWMMSILLARSCVSYQGRRPQTKPTGASLSRAGTRRGPNKPGQTLVSVPPPTVQTAPAKAVFEPGSLLASRMM